MKRSISTSALLAAALAAGAQTVTLTDGTQLPDAMKSFTALPTLGKIFINEKPIDSDKLQSIEVLSQSDIDRKMQGLGMVPYIGCAESIQLYTFIATPPTSGRSNYSSDWSLYYSTMSKQLPVSFIVPTDEAFKHYVDVHSFATQVPRTLEMTLNNKRLAGASYAFSIESGETGEANTSDRVYDSELNSYTARILKAHTVVGDIKSGNRYYQALDGNVVCVGDDGTLQGAYQMSDTRIGRAHIQDETELQPDGAHYYVVDSLLIPAPRSAYKTLATDERCSEFFKLCEELQTALYDEEWRWGEEREYNSIFTATRGCPDKIILRQFNGVSMPFSIFVPTNEAIKAERSAGRLNTWRQKRDFLLYHICYGADYADRLPFDKKMRRSMLVEEGTLRVPAVYVASAGNDDLTVTDVMGNTRHVVKGSENIFTYDYDMISSSTGGYPRNGLENLASMQGLMPQTVNPGVIHIIDGVLRHK